MQITVMWDNSDRTVMRFDFPVAWNWTAFDQACTTAFEQIASVTQPVDVIFDLSSNVNVPDGLTLHVRNTLAAAPTNLRVVIIVADHPLVTSNFEVLARLHRGTAGRLIIVPSMESARTALAHKSTFSRVVSPARLNR